jgi:hypothetical protein
MDEIERIKKLAGVTEFKGYQEYSPASTVEERSQRAAEIKETEKEHDFEPGTPEWFDLWFKMTNGLNQVPAFRGRK